MEVENLHPDTLISMKMVYDEILTTSGNAYAYEITPELLASTKSARMKYEQHLEDGKKQKRDKQEGQKRKLVSDKVKEITTKKLKLSETVQRLNEEATSLALQAEKKKDFHLLTKSNAFRKNIDEKKTELKKLEKKLLQLENDTKKV